VRVVDVFVDELELGALGFEGVDPGTSFSLILAPIRRPNMIRNCSVVPTAVIDGESLPWIPFTPYADNVPLKSSNLTRSAVFAAAGCGPLAMSQYAKKLSHHAHSTALVLPKMSPSFLPCNTSDQG
jgi:hypothetical protein